MKRKASNALDTEGSSSVDKESEGSENDDLNSSLSNKATMERTLISPRSASGRQRKAPAWLSSYVTDGSTSVKEPPKPTKSKSPASTSPVKKKGSKSFQVSAEEHVDGQPKGDEEPPSLRRGSTIKVEDSPPSSNKNKKSQNNLAHSSSLVRKDTEILSSSASDSGDSLVESKTDFKVSDMKSVISNCLDKSQVPVSSSSSQSSSTKCQSISVPFKVPPEQHLTSQSSIHEFDGVEEDNNIPEVMEVCETHNFIEGGTVELKAANSSSQPAVGEQTVSNTVLEKPKMLEVVICISTSGAMRDYLTVLQEKTRDLVWRLQSLIPDLRIGVLAHTQGGIHDDKPGSGSSASDHNYIRTGGHSGTKWLDLGATFSQICAFVDSLGKMTEPEATVYPDYVQDNLEMALWKVQRCMSWSSCSYRTVVMIGRGRPNRTSFYLQREHWRGWIRSALEIKPKAEIPVIDWELEAKLLAQMGIHVFTIQASSVKTQTEEEEDEGSVFFRRVAEITNGLHIRLTEASKLIDIIVGVCCACHGPDLLQNHRETLRDENDGVLPPQLKDIFVSLQLHSKRRSLSTIPSLVGDLSILKSQLAKADANGNISSEEEEEDNEDASGDEGEQKSEGKRKNINKKSTKSLVPKSSRKSNAKSVGKNLGIVKKAAKNNSVSSKSGLNAKNQKSQTIKSRKLEKKDVKAFKTIKADKKNAKNTAATKIKANKKVLGQKKIVSSLKKQSLKKEVDKKVKSTAKQVKNQNLKAVAKRVIKKGAGAKSATMKAVSQKKNSSKSNAS